MKPNPLGLTHPVDPIDEQRMIMDHIKDKLKEIFPNVSTAHRLMRIIRYSINSYHMTVYVSILDENILFSTADDVGNPGTEIPLADPECFNKVYKLVIEYFLKETKKEVEKLEKQLKEVS